MLGYWNDNVTAAFNTALEFGFEDCFFVNCKPGTAWYNNVYTIHFKWLKPSLQVKSEL